MQGAGALQPSSALLEAETLSADVAVRPLSMHGRLTLGALRCNLWTHRRIIGQLKVKVAAAAPQTFRAVANMAVELHADPDRCVHPKPNPRHSPPGRSPRTTLSARLSSGDLTTVFSIAHRSAAHDRVTSQLGASTSVFDEPVAGRLRIARQLMSVAPMMDWTDVYFRQLARLLSRHTWLYTEMVVVSCKEATLLLMAPDCRLVMKRNGQHSGQQSARQNPAR